LRSRGVEPEIIEYLITSPKTDEIKSIIDILDVEPQNLVRVKEVDFVNSGIDLGNIDSIASGIAANPKLLERPIVLHNGIAIIGRPPENIEKLF